MEVGASGSGNAEAQRLMRRLGVCILILLLGAGRSSRAASAEGDVRDTAADAYETLSDDPRISLDHPLVRGVASHGQE